MMAREPSPKRATTCPTGPRLMRFALWRKENRRARSVFVVIEPSDPGGQSLDRRLEFGMLVDELLQSSGEPLDVHLLVATPLDEFFDASVGEVHQAKADATISRCCASCT